jgi:hypothetical protein
VEGTVYLLPPLPHARLGWHKVSVELRTTADAAPYLSNRHGPDASVNPCRCPRDFSEIIEAQQLIRSTISSQTGTDPPEERPPTGAGEVNVHLPFDVYVTTIGHPFFACL